MQQMLKMCAFSHHALVAGDWLASVLCNYVVSFTKKPGQEPRSSFVWEVKRCPLAFR